MKSKIIDITCTKCGGIIKYNMDNFGNDSQHIEHGDHCITLYDDEIVRQLEKQGLAWFDRTTNSWKFSI